MADAAALEPESTAARVALWRAMHVQIDAPPHVLEDEIGLQLVAPDPGWRQRPDMDPQGTATFRAHIVARSRFIEDLVIEQAERGVRQYVLLGAGLDTFAQRHTDDASKLRIYEVDQPDPQVWKRKRLMELGFGVPDWLRLVPVNFEAGSSWSAELAAAGFDAAQPAIVASTGVTQYLTREAISAMLRQAAALAPRSTFVTTFMLRVDLLPADEQQVTQWAIAGAKASGTPFISLFSPEEMVALASECGLQNVRHVSTAQLAARYFSGRPDGLRPATGEQFIIATI